MATERQAQLAQLPPVLSLIGEQPIGETMEGADVVVLRAGMGRGAPAHTSRKDFAAIVAAL